MEALEESRQPVARERASGTIEGFLEGFREVRDYLSRQESPSDAMGARVAGSSGRSVASPVNT